MKAVFEEESEKFKLTVEKEGQGTVEPSEGEHLYLEDEVVDLSAIPTEGWAFVEWIGDVANTGSANTTVTMDEDKTVKAVFVEEGYIPEDPGDRTAHTAGNVDFFMRLAPASTFPAGTSDDGEVTISYDFWVAETQVTYELWYSVRIWALNEGYSFTNDGKEGNNGEIGEEPSDRKNEPVTRINWYDSIVWCNALSEYLGLDPVYTVNEEVIKNTTGVEHLSVVAEANNGFRLLTRNEWELAARYRGTDSSYGAIEYPADTGNYWTPGNYASGATESYLNSDATKKAAWYLSNSSKTQNVGQKPLHGNGLGVFDMSGNVSEWNFTVKDINRYTSGGSYNSPAGLLQVGYLSSLYPTSLYNTQGLRVARTDH